uniref:non-structural maintenance of chromosomes element 1 homolog isoform X2 n=1 Tax=Myxine glutinosa TaxID=7769 RepID=UPI00358E8A5D
MTSIQDKDGRALLIDVSARTVFISRFPPEGRAAHHNTVQHNLFLCVSGMANMTDAHRLFLQYLMVRPCVEAHECRKLQNECCNSFQEHNDLDSLEKFVETINSNLIPLGFIEIRQGFSQEGNKVYALVNTAETEITLMASDYTESELEVFKTILEQVVVSSDGSVSSVRVLNRSDKIKGKKIKKDEVQVLLQRMVQDGWLFDNNGDISLSTRCVLEMEPYICRHYPHVDKCLLCKRIALQGKTCAECNCKMHMYCAKTYMTPNRSTYCPQCKTPMTLRPGASQESSSSASSGSSAASTSRISSRTSRDTTKRPAKP